MLNQQLSLWQEANLHFAAPALKPAMLPLADAEVQIYESFWSAAESDRYFTQLLQETVWKQETAHLLAQAIPIPRLSAWVGDAGKTYAYSGIEMCPSPWTPTLLELKTAVETIVAASFNSVLLNLYRHGQDSVGWHSDDEPELGRNPRIASVSFGATRRFSLKHKRRKDLKPCHLDLASGSLLLMQGTTQHDWLHQVPKTTKPVGPRINLTFRTIGSS